MAQQNLDAYLELENIKGETTDKTLKMNIQLRSFDLGFSESDGDDDLEKATDRVEEISKKGDSASPSEKVELMRLVKKLPSLMEKMQDRARDRFLAENDTITGRQASLAKRYSFKISKDTDSSSPALFKAYFSTSDPKKTLVYPKATLNVRRTGMYTSAPAPYLTLVFTQVMVIGWKLESEADSVPEEKVKFSFKTYTMQYTAQLKSGANGVKVGPLGWDFDKNVQI
ncbi:MAG TPA: type VI secretion system tube protein Hcp [Pirellulales bacterium]